MKRQAGFTLIELIIVIVILGILAAYAVPKYMSIDKEARIAVTKGLKGTLLATVDLVHATAVAKGANSAATNIDIGGGVVVDLSQLYPATSKNGIGRAISDVEGFNEAYTTTTANYTKNGATTPATCWTMYTLSANGVPSVTSNTDGC